MNRRDLGSFGEEQAAKYLRRKGYTLVGMNYRCRQGEIDLIVRGRGCIVFVEVKLRRDERFAQAREFVTRAMQERILTTAQLWLSENETGLQPRFDVIEIYAPAGADGPIRIEHIENAFS